MKNIKNIKADFLCKNIIDKIIVKLKNKNASLLLLLTEKNGRTKIQQPIKKNYNGTIDDFILKCINLYENIKDEQNKIIYDKLLHCSSNELAKILLDEFKIDDVYFKEFVNCICTDNKGFIINFDMIINILEVRKKNLKRLLVSKFKKNEDYIIKKEKVANKNGPGTNYVDIINLTHMCFKSLCLGKTHNVVLRNQFIALESILIKFKHFFQIK